MPSAANNVKVDKPALPSAENADVSGPAGALKQAIVVIEHKIRNLEKRKSKLESYRDLQNSGKELNTDQKTALAKINEVLTTLDFAKDLHKQFLGIVLSTEKEAKKHAKREAAIKTQAELARLREILLVQDAINQMGTENVRNDFLNGTGGATQLSETELKLLDDLYPAVTPKHEAGNPTVFTNEVQAAAEHLLAVVDGKTKEVFGGSYSQIKEVLGKIHESGYFDQAVAVEGLVEEEATIEAPLQEELVEPVTEEVFETTSEPAPIAPIESITIEASNHPALHGAQPAPLMVDPSIPPQVGAQPPLPPQTSQVPPPVVQADLSFYQQQPQQMPPPVAQQPPLQPMRPIAELVGTGSFFFLQESEIDTPDQIPTQTFTNQTYVGQPPPPIPMPPNFQPHQMPPNASVVNHQANVPLEEPTMHKPVDDLQKRGPPHQSQPARGHSNTQNPHQQHYYNNGYNGRSNQRPPPQQSRNNGISGPPPHHQPRAQAARH